MKLSDFELLYDLPTGSADPGKIDGVRGAGRDDDA